MKLTFHGAAGHVTGSNFLLESQGEKILIDCGLIQGGRYVEKKNFEPFAYDPKEISAVFVTHAHIDHIGRLPKLAGEGFGGKIYSTPPTREFARHLLEDSISILTREANACNEETFCNTDILDKVFDIWEVEHYHKKLKHGPFTITFHDAGHTLGSAFIEVKVEGKTIVFSGDLGNSPAPLIKPRENLSFPVDYCVMESTYGGRVHKGSVDIQKELEKVITDTIWLGGTLMIPAFAMERTQALLYHINQLIEEKKIPPTPVFLDSPLAIRLTDVYAKYKDEALNDHAQDFLDEQGKIFKFPTLTRTMKTEDSKKILKAKPPKIVIAGSGMSTAGRILHHEKNYLPDPNSFLLIVGYQAKGSLGRKILDGEKEVKIMGKTVPVRANHKAIGGYSAHADQPQLLEWIGGAKDSVKKAFTVHGEESQAEELASKIKSELGLEVVEPKIGDSVEL